ncbi:MAG: type I-C CRISPR-associated protein Cas8c/Csd1 [Bacillota bacterium]|nr:type I-C CRISPR-associated protein Cas8c/Csd1 [Bacillota bacterium]
MSWQNELYQIYENNYGKVDEEVPLQPIFHSAVKAQVEITVSEKGEFCSAVSIMDKTDADTVIPVTEDSGTRSSGIAPHPFADKLLYIAGDYGKFVAGKRGDNRRYYQAYMEQLKNWNDSSDSHPAVRAVYIYLSKGRLLSDLIEGRCLHLDEKTGKLNQKDKILNIAQEDVFVRFRVNYKEILKTESRTWKDPSLYESFILYHTEQQYRMQLCYATGRLTFCTYKHPAKIRNAGDKAKLISSNDENGFSYRGRFDSKEQALSVGYVFSQKMHNALKWLIEKQGIIIGSMTVIAWASNMQPLPEIIGNPEDDLEDDWGMLEEADHVESEVVSDTMPIYRERLRKAVWGQKNEIYAHKENNNKVMVMVLDSATTGRLSMSMYEELRISEFYRNIECWHFDTAWNCFCGKDKVNQIRSFSLYEIVDFAYGTEQGDFIKCKPEIRNRAILKLIPSVINGRKIPREIVRNLVNKASKPTAYEHSYNWRKVLETACGMIRKTIIEEKKERGEKEEYDVALEERCRERDYLYGRLLAVAEVAERVTYKKGEERLTNASRYFEAFSNRPYQTWGIIYKRLIPYLNRMEYGQKRYYENLIIEIEDQFEKDEFEDNKKLKPLFLLGYHCQLKNISSKKKVSGEEKS